MTTKPKKMGTTGPQATTDDVFAEAERLALAASADPALIEEYEIATRRAREIERGGYKRRIAMGKARTQNEKLIHHMLNIGPISLREALLEYNVTSLTRRICDIQEMGYRIVKDQRHNPVTGQEYTRYGIEHLQIAAAE